jgi:hypothetical protein
MTAYPASAYLWLRDFDTARTHGEAALAAVESAPPGSREQRQSFAQLILATALVGLGTPDHAVALGSQALTSTRVVTSGVVTYAHDLDRALVSRYPRLACAREFHEQYRQVAQRSTTEGKS